MNISDYLLKRLAAWGVRVDSKEGGIIKQAVRQLFPSVVEKS